METKKLLLIVFLPIFILISKTGESQTVATPAFSVQREATGEVLQKYDTLFDIRIILTVPAEIKVKRVKVKGKAKANTPEKISLTVDPSDKTLISKKVVSVEGGKIIIDLGAHTISEGLYTFSVDLVDTKGETLEAKEEPLVISSK